MSDPTRRVNTEMLRNGRASGSTRASTVPNRVRAEVIAPPPEVIPVILIPGIMGTNLKNAKGEQMWRPPNGTGSTLATAWDFGWSGPAARQRRLNPRTTQVDSRGTIEVEMTVSTATDDDPTSPPMTVRRTRAGISTEEARARGWGELHWASYGSFLIYLNDRFHSIATEKNRMAEFVRNAARSLGEAEQPRLEGIARAISRYQFPVYACGYNWLQSNYISAEGIRARLPGIRQRAERVHGGPVKGFILVTHSMGGLVARALAKLHNEESILGIVHGVMPADGAAATYKRIRGGFEGVSQLVLGRNAREVAPVLGNSAGGLELLPNKRYGASWLKGEIQQVEQLPSFGMRPGIMPPPIVRGAASAASLVAGSDPYGAIYRNETSWYRLIADKSWLDPAGLNGGPEGAWATFETALDEAEFLHDGLAQADGGYHARTYAYWGADAKQLAWGDVVWKCETFNGLPLAAFRGATSLSDNANGRVQLQGSAGTFWVNLQGPNEPGDGTVPRRSGRGPLGGAGVNTCRELTDMGKQDHQMSYENEAAREYTEYGILSIAGALEAP